MKTGILLTISILAMSLFTLQAQPTGINRDADTIMLNGADWSEMMKVLNDNGDDSKFTIVHVGDSHIQPGIFTGVVRSQLQQRYGNGGRGLVCPLKLARSHAPSDYVMKSSSPVSASSRLLTKSRPAGMGVTGVAVKFAGGTTTLGIEVKKTSDSFNEVTLLHSLDEPFEVSSSEGDISQEEISPTATRVSLKELACGVDLRLKGKGALYGALLLNNTHGVVVDCIGNDGATYSSYARIDGFGEQLSNLNPQLVIISLGTNEAYGNVDALEGNLDALVKTIIKANPNAKILLTTPLETHKKGGRGYVVQDGIASVRSTLMNYGKTHHIAVWDLYTVGGGSGAASRWLGAKYMSSDHLHLLPDGYRLCGELLSEALIKTFRALGAK